MTTRLLPILLFAATTLSAQAAPTPGGDQQATTLKPVSSTAQQPIGGQRAIDLLALETDLTPRLVRIVLLHRPAENYTFGHQRNAARQFEAVLGEERYSALMAGRPIELYSPQVKEAARAIAASAQREAAQAVLVAAVD